VEQLRVIRPLVDRIEKLGNPYFITRSIARSHCGILRRTHDAAMVLAIGEEVDRLFNLLNSDGQGFSPKKALVEFIGLHFQKDHMHHTWMKWVNKDIVLLLHHR
jgi:hypothetical protein